MLEGKEMLRKKKRRRGWKCYKKKKKKMMMMMMMMIMMMIIIMIIIMIMMMTSKGASLDCPSSSQFPRNVSNTQTHAQGNRAMSESPTPQLSHFARRLCSFEIVLSFNVFIEVTATVALW